MLLDLNQSDQQLWAQPKSNEGARLPATTEEGFAAAWNEAKLFSHSNAQAMAQHQALMDYVDDVRKRTGVDLTPAAAHIVVNADWSKANDEIAKLNASNPDLGLEPLTPDLLDRRAAVLSRQARQAYVEQQAGEGGGFGRFLGGLASAATDPFNVALAPFGGGEAGVLVTALKFGGLAAASQVANEAVQEGFRERVQPGYGASGEPGMNILEAGASGAILGGGLKALGNAWTRVKTGTWPPTVRDAGNVIESEAHIQQSNVYPGASGDAAHRDALASATDQIIKGEPVHVEEHITPEVETSVGGQIEEPRARAVATAEAALAARTAEPDLLIDPLLEQTRALGSPMEIAQRWAQDPEGTWDAISALIPKLKAAEREIAKRHGVKLADIEDAPLSPKEDHFLFRDARLGADYWSELRSQLQPVESLPEAAREIAYEFKRLPKDMGNLSDADDRTFARLQVLFSEVGRLGGDLRGVLREAASRYGARFGDPEDAIFMVQNAAQKLRTMMGEPRPAKSPPQLRLPFEATAAETLAEGGMIDLRARVAQIAESGGHALSSEEVAAIAERLARASPEEAAAALRDIKVSPRQLAAQPLRPPKVAEPEPLTARSPEEAAQMLASPDHEAALRSDIDRARATGDVKIPAGVDERGEPVFRSLDSALDEVDNFKKAADEIQACAAPVQAEAAE